MNKIQRVILVDDDPVANMINSLLLKDFNLSEKIDIAMNGEEALSFIRNISETDNKISKNSPAIIFLDLKMPIMDGFEFLETFDKLEQDLKEKFLIVLLTSSSSKKDVERSSNHTIWGYLSKPLTTEKVYLIMEEAKISSRTN